MSGDNGQMSDEEQKEKEEQEGEGEEDEESGENSSSSSSSGKDKKQQESSSSEIQTIDKNKEEIEEAALQKWWLHHPTAQNERHEFKLIRNPDTNKYDKFCCLRCDPNQTRPKTLSYAGQHCTGKEHHVAKGLVAPPSKKAPRRQKQSQPTKKREREDDDDDSSSSSSSSSDSGSSDSSEPVALFEEDEELDTIYKENYRKALKLEMKKLAEQNAEKDAKKMIEQRKKKK
jgi:hypothetical protein